MDDGEVIFELLFPLVLPEGDGDHRYGFFVFEQKVFPAFLVDYSSNVIVFYGAVIYVIASLFRAAFLPRTLSSSSRLTVPALINVIAFFFSLISCFSLASVSFSRIIEQRLLLNKNH